VSERQQDGGGGQRGVDALRLDRNPPARSPVLTRPPPRPRRSARRHGAAPSTRNPRAVAARLTENPAWNVASSHLCSESEPRFRCTTSHASLRSSRRGIHAPASRATRSCRRGWAGWSGSCGSDVLGNIVGEGGVDVGAPRLRIPTHEVECSLVDVDRPHGRMRRRDREAQRDRPHPHPRSSRWPPGGAGGVLARSTAVPPST
jgi:hypothetical protein